MENRIKVAIVLASMFSLAGSRVRLPDEELARIARDAANKYERVTLPDSAWRTSLQDAVLVRVTLRPTGDDVAATGGVDVFLDPHTGKVLDARGRP